MVHVAGTEVAVAGILVAMLTVFDFIQRSSRPLAGFLAGEGETLVVARKVLVDVGLTVGQVLQVLHWMARVVGYPTGTA